MALGVEAVPAGRVVRKTVLLTIGTLGFTFCLTLLFLGMRAVMDVEDYELAKDAILHDEVGP